MNMEERLEINLFNDQLNYQDVLYLFHNTSAILSGQTNEPPKIAYINEKAFEWIKSDSELFEPFNLMAKQLDGVTADTLLTHFIKMMVLDDDSTRNVKVLCNPKITKKDKFLEAFRKVQKHWSPKGILSVLSPDLMRCLFGYEVHIKTGATSIELPPDLVPIVLPVTEVMPDRPPEGFERGVPYESDAFSQEQKSFFDRFNFLKPKVKNTN